MGHRTQGVRCASRGNRYQILRDQIHQCRRKDPEKQDRPLRQCDCRSGDVAGLERTDRGQGRPPAETIWLKSLVSRPDPSASLCANPSSGTCERKGPFADPRSNDGPVKLIVRSAANCWTQPFLSCRRVFNGPGDVSTSRSRPSATCSVRFSIIMGTMRAAKVQMDCGLKPCRTVGPYQSAAALAADSRP